ncbi:MAG: hypothetical protein AMXMBFR53_10130 [Gemmatimonadota bacterium]
MRVRRPSPVSLLALLLVAGGLFAMRPGRKPAPAQPEACGPAGGSDCDPRPGERSEARGALPTPTPSSLPTVSGETACRNSGYLCVELQTYDRIQIHRWKGFEGTLVVRVPRPQVDGLLAQQLQRAATAGILLWNGQPFPILVDERGTRDADFSVRWVTSLGGGQIGVARTQWSPQRGLSVVSLELAINNPYSGRPMDPREVRLVAAHEMGHALGLPHSDEPRDVMYPTNTATTLSARDYRTLEAIYALEDGTEILRAPRR